VSVQNFLSLRRFRRDIGFTLTELVIAMVVLAIVASVAIPSFLGSRNNSYDKEAQSSIENILKAAKFHYQNQGDFSDASSAQCGDSTGLAADLQKLEPGIDVVVSSVSSTNSRIVSVQAVQTWDSTGGLLGCQGFYALALSSSGSCWAARIILEGKYLASGSVSPVVVNQQTNTSNNAVTTWSALAVNGSAFSVLKPQTSAADGKIADNLAAIKTACKAKTQSTGSATIRKNYIAPSEFYSSWRDISPAGTVYAVGDTGPGGGIVFYVQAGGGTFTSTGSDCAETNVCKYLESAPSDQSAGVVLATAVAACYTGNPAIFSSCQFFGIYQQSNQDASRIAATPIGMGMANTNQIYSRVTAAGSEPTANYAAGIAWAYSNGGITDWHLPSKDELNQLYINRVAVGGFSAASYWSSSEYDGEDHWIQSFANGAQNNVGKSRTHYVRPIRAFG